MEQSAGTKPKPTSELKSAWGKHVRAWMLANPGVSYREAQTQSKASYKSAAKPKAAPRVKPAPKLKKAPKPKPAPTVKAERKQDHLEPWRAHVAEHRAQNPGTSLKEVLQAAKVTYRAPKLEVEEKKHVVKKSKKRDEYDEAYPTVAYTGEGRSKPQELLTGAPVVIEAPALPPSLMIEAPKPVWVHQKRGAPKPCEYGCGRRRCSCAHAMYYE